MGLLSRLNPFKSAQTELRSSGAVGLSAGAGVFYGLDDAHSGQLFIDDLGQSREILERAPAVGIVASVIGRFFKSIPLKLVTEDGEEHKGRGIHPVLRLLNERPNEFQSATSFREMLAQEMVYTGEAVLRVHRAGTTPHRVFCWPSNQVSVNQENDWGIQLDQAIIYAYATQSFALDPELPQVCHARLNVDPQHPLRGRPAVYGMYPEVLANHFGSMLRKETFRQAVLRAWRWCAKLTRQRPTKPRCSRWRSRSPMPSRRWLRGSAHRFCQRDGSQKTWARRGATR